MKEITNLDELINVIRSLPNVKSVKVPTEPTGFCSGERRIYSSEENWKEQIIDTCVSVVNNSKKPILRFSFSGYYGEEPIANNEYYIQLWNEDGIHTANALSSGAHGSLD